MALAAAALLLGGATAPSAIEWAYPGAGASQPPPPTPPGGFSLGNSARHYSYAELKDRRRAVDWFPAGHPPAPAPVLVAARPEAFACGFCHLPDGTGRPENAPLAGLPADYIAEQVADIASGARDVHPGWGPIAGMQQAARAATPDEVREVARYFAALPFRPHLRVVEASEIPAARAVGFIYRIDPAGGREPLGSRIVEAPEDFERFELRDTATPYVAYVPPGSIAAGRRLASSGGPAGQPCAGCHGEGLHGSPIAPPLAGRSPSYLVRQLDAFASGARHGTGAAPMHAVAAPLDGKQMIALAAYAGSRRP